MGISREQVWQVADAIVGEGAEPRYLLVRERLGTGSFSTICKFLRQWRAQRGDGESPAPETEVPPPFRDAVLQLSAEAWKVARGWMQAEITAARESGRRRIEELTQELAADAEQASQAVDALQEQIEELQAERARVQTQKGALTEQQQALAERLLKVEGTLAELRGQVERAEAQAIVLQERNAELTRQVVEAQAGAAEKVHRLEEAQSQIATLQGSLEAALQEHESLRQHHQETLRQLAAAEGALAEAREGRVRAEQSLARFELRWEEWAARWSVPTPLPCSDSDTGNG